VAERILEVKQLRKVFPVRAGVLGFFHKERRRSIIAVDRLNFDVLRGEILGIVGESGCGKTTTGRILVGVEKPSEGQVLFKGQDRFRKEDKDVRKKLNREIQLIFQDPYACLSPWLTVGELLAEPLWINRLTTTKEDESQKVQDVMRLVGLSDIETFSPKYPHELSGGQRQRVVIARALMLQPEFLVADEPVSMVDVSTRLGILNVFLELREKRRISCVYITHDLASSRYMCDRVAVMYLGKMVEIGSTDDVIYSPLHPYTKALIAAVPTPNPRIRRPEIAIKGEVQTLVDVPLGCRFHPRCLYAKEKCSSEEPELRGLGENHLVACHFAEELGLEASSKRKHTPTRNSVI